jgi:hypothetical protein
VNRIMDTTAVHATRSRAVRIVRTDTKYKKIS